MSNLKPWMAKAFSHSACSGIYFPMPHWQHLPVHNMNLLGAAGISLSSLLKSIRQNGFGSPAGTSAWTTHELAALVFWSYIASARNSLRWSWSLSLRTKNKPNLGPSECHHSCVCNHLWHNADKLSKFVERFHNKCVAVNVKWESGKESPLGHRQSFCRTSFEPKDGKKNYRKLFQVMHSAKILHVPEGLKSSPFLIVPLQMLPDLTYLTAKKKKKFASSKHA